MSNEKPTVVPVFKIMARKNAGESKTQGRPIYRDIEVCEIRFSGDKNRVTVVPAHEVWKWQDGEEITYAMRWPEQYQRFKKGIQQSQDGTPIEELPFLSTGKRLELKALNIYTAESLADLEGNNLKTLGIGGRELKNQAKAYLDNATGSAKVTAMASEIELLKLQIAEMTALNAPEPVVSAQDAVDDEGLEFQGWDDARLKGYIKDRSGSTPRGNPSHESLIRMAAELSVESAEAA